MKSPLMKGIACAMTLAMALAPCPALAQEASASKPAEASAGAAAQAVPTGKADAAQDETSAKSSRDDETSSKTPSSETAAGKDSTQVGKEASSTGKSDPQKSAPDPDEPADDSAKEDADGTNAVAEDKKAADGITILSGGSWQNTEDGKKQYLRQDGTLAKDGLYEIDGKRYLFSKDGFVQTGWQTVEYQGKQQRFHFQDSGIADTGVKTISGTLYCFDEATAVMLTPSMARPISSMHPAQRFVAGSRPMASGTVSTIRPASFRRAGLPRAAADIGSMRRLVPWPRDGQRYRTFGIGSMLRDT